MTPLSDNADPLSKLKELEGEQTRLVAIRQCPPIFDRMLTDTLAHSDSVRTNHRGILACRK